jgi:prepilin-type N-terminal cleavage/methylation domain-containing protein
MHRDRGFTIVEIIVAMVLVSIVLMASVQLTIAMLRIVGRTGSPEERPARLRSVATAWAQAELEFIQQIGFYTACPSALPSCSFWSPRDCTGYPAVFPDPYAGDGPKPPEAFYAVHIVVDYDPTGPPDDLRLVKVELYRSPPECKSGTPFLEASTSLGDPQ